MIDQATPELLYRLAAFAVNAFSIAVYARATPEFDARVLNLLRRAANVARALSLFGLLGLYLQWSSAAGGFGSSANRALSGHPASPRWVLAIVAVGIVPSVLALLARSRARK